MSKHKIDTGSMTDAIVGWGQGDAVYYTEVTETLPDGEREVVAVGEFETPEALAEMLERWGVTLDERTIETLYEDRATETAQALESAARQFPFPFGEDDMANHHPGIPQAAVETVLHLENMERRQTFAERFKAEIMSPIEGLQRLWGNFEERPFATIWGGVEQVGGHMWDAALTEFGSARHDVRNAFEQATFGRDIYPRHDDKHGIHGPAEQAPAKGHAAPEVTAHAVSPVEAAEIAHDDLYGASKEPPPPEPEAPNYGPEM